MEGIRFIKVVKVKREDRRTGSLFTHFLLVHIQKNLESLKINVKKFVMCVYMCLCTQ